MNTEIIENILGETVNEPEAVIVIEHIKECQSQVEAIETLALLVKILLKNRNNSYKIIGDLCSCGHQQPQKLESDPIDPITSYLGRK